MKRLWIIKLGTTFPATRKQFGDMNDWIESALGPLTIDVCTIDAANGDPLPSPDECAAIVMTGSHAMVTDNLPWSVAVARWLPSLLDAGIPILGICYGHQLLAHAAGGVVDYHAKGREIGTVPVRRLPASAHDPLFQRLPESFTAHACHSQTVLKLPPDAVALACNDHDSHHAFRVGTCAWGVQFHPEYTPGIMRSYIEQRAEALASEGMSVPGLLDAVAETPDAAAMLRAFGRLAEQPALRFSS